MAIGNLGALLEELFGTESWGEHVLRLRIDADYLLPFDDLLLRATAPEVRAAWSRLWRWKGRQLRSGGPALPCRRQRLLPPLRAG